MSSSHYDDAEPNISSAVVFSLAVVVVTDEHFLYLF